MNPAKKKNVTASFSVVGPCVNNASPDMVRPTRRNVSAVRVLQEAVLLLH